MKLDSNDKITECFTIFTDLFPILLFRLMTISNRTVTHIPYIQLVKELGYLNFYPVYKKHN